MKCIGTRMHISSDWLQIGHLIHGAMEIMEGMMNAAEYTKIRLKHLLKSVSGLRLDTDFVSQQDNDNK